MSEIKDLIFNPDLIGIKTEYLESIAQQYDIKTQNEDLELAVELWKKMQNSSDLKQEISDKIQDYVFAGKTSVTWFLFFNARQYFNIEAVNKVFSRPNENEITNTPCLLGLAEMKKDVYLARFLIKVKDERRVSGYDFIRIPVYDYPTAIISLKNDFIEVRAEPKTVSKVIGYIKQHLINSPDANIKQIENFTEETIAEWTQELKGNLIETHSHPERLLENMSDIQVKSVIEVLTALNEYFVSANIDYLEEKLKEVHKLFGDLSSIPFLALILVGMDRITMGTVKGEDLRKKALYKLLLPHIKHAKGYIQIPVVENGITKLYTIRIGIGTKSVFFISAATESAIEIVRKQVLKQKEG